MRNKIKRVPPVIDMNANGFEEGYDLIIQDEGVRETIFKLTIDGITHAVQNNLKEIDLFQLEGRVALKITRDKFKIPLKKAQEFYSAKEDFDKCIDLQQLMDKV